MLEKERLWYAKSWSNSHTLLKTRLSEHYRRNKKSHKTDAFLYRHFTNQFTKVSEYDQGIPQSHTTDQPTAPRGRVTEHFQ